MQNLNPQSPLNTKISDHGLEIPANIEAEEAILGALLVNNKIYDHVENILLPEHFYLPINQRIYELIAKRIHEGKLASHVSLKGLLKNDHDLENVGGEDYLKRLAQAAMMLSSTADFAHIVRNLAMRRELIEIGENLSAQARNISNDQKPEDQIVEAEKSLYELAETGSHQRGVVNFSTAVLESVNAVKEAFQRDGELSGIATGLNDLDKLLGGLHKSDLIILAGRPSMGKTSLATNIAYNIAKKYTADEGNSGGRVLFFSLEMSAEQLATRILSDSASLSSHNLRTGQLSDADFRNYVNASMELSNMPLYIDDTAALPISSMAARARRVKRQYGLDLIIVDYLQLLRGFSKDNRVNEVSEITQALKAIAKELNIPVIALSQLSRQVEQREDNRPQLSDLRESGSIEQDADVVMFVYREEYYLARKEPKEDDHNFQEWFEKATKAHGVAEVIVGKQRHGPINTVKLSFDAKFTRFGNLANERHGSEDDFM